MSIITHRPALLALLLALPVGAHAQGEPAPPLPPVGETSAVPDNEIIVTAPGERGKVIGQGVPDIRIGRDEIASYGSENVGDLLGDLTPQTGEKPVILVNGRRVSGMDEISRLPPEAIERVDILPEEVALNYGYRADQRVVNIVLVNRFRAATGTLSADAATAGGYGAKNAKANFVRIGPEGRLSLDLDYGRKGALRESERDIVSPTADGRDRTLLPAEQTLGLGAAFSRTIFGNMSATLDGRYARQERESLFGLPSDPLAIDPLGGRARTSSGHVGLALNGRVAQWNLSLLSNWDESRTHTDTDRDAGTVVVRDSASSTTRSVSVDLVANGAVAKLPAGKISTTLKASVARRSLDSSTVQGNVAEQRNLANNQTQLSANINLPIASRRDHVLTAIGDLSANLNVGRDRLSSVGAADSFGYGLSWSPIEAIRLTATMSRAEGLPPVAQRGDPAISTPNVPIYDFVRGEAVDITRIDGGNPDLRAENRRVFSLSGRYKPFVRSSLTFNLSYSSSLTRNMLGSLPAATPEIEAAFPDRFTRDEDGRLLSIDNRPVNLASATQRQLNWGLFYSIPFGKVPPVRRRNAEAARGDAPTAAGADIAVMAAQYEAPLDSSFGRGDGLAPGQGRILMSFNHSVRLQDELLIRKGLPSLDLLDGATLGGRGQARHQLSLGANVMKDGLGARFEARWDSGSSIHGSATDLDFSALSTASLRVFANLGEQAPLVAKLRWLSGTRVSLAVNNILDSKTRVHDALGNVPFGYQPDYLDPIGRSVRFSVRKQL